MPLVDRDLPDINPALVRASMLGALELVISAVLALVVSLRPLTAGQAASEPEATFVASLVWFAAFVWLLHKLLGLELSFVRAPMLLGVLVFAAFVALAVRRAWTHGNGQAALDMGLDWAADLLLLTMVADHCRERTRFRLLLSCLVAGLAAVMVYSLYQRGYGMEYFRGTLAANPQGMLSITGNDKLQQSLYRARVNSLRVGGPFGYPNALAGYVLLLLPVLAGLLVVAGKAFIRRVALLVVVGAGLLVIVLTGSKAGFLAAKVVEIGGLLLLLPRGQRWWSRAWAVVAGVVCGTALGLACGGMLAVVDLRTVAQVIFAGLWGAELLVLGRMLLGSRVPGRAVAVAGGGCLALGVALSVFVLAGPQLGEAGARVGPSGSDQRIMSGVAQLQQEARKTVMVRANYWIAALRMAGKFPLRGVGLDNFGSRYTQFKTVSGWAVKRAHNHYLQLAADGGVGLLLSFILVWGLFFCCRPGVGCAREAGSNNDNKPPAEMPKVHRQMRILGLLAGLGAFGIIYYLYLRGLFMGLSLEFFLNELNANQGTGAIRAMTGSWGPAIIHGGVHLALMPAVWVGAFLLAWKVSGSADPGALRGWLKLGIAGMLLHAFADFHLMNAAVSGTFWAVAGLALASGNLPSLRLRLSRHTGLLVALVCVVGGAAFINLVVLAQMKGAFAARAAEVGRELYLNARDQDARDKAYKEALGSCAVAIKMRPRDGQLHRQQAELLFVAINDGLQRKIAPGMRPEDMAARKNMLMRMLPHQKRDQVLAGWRMVIAYDPYFASGYEVYAQRMLALYPDNRARVEEAVGFMEKACCLHPYKPQYRLELGELYAKLGRNKQAMLMLRGALRLNCVVTDQRAKLNAREQRDAEFGLRYLRGGK